MDGRGESEKAFRTWIRSGDKIWFVQPGDRHITNLRNDLSITNLKKMSTHSIVLQLAAPKVRHKAYQSRPLQTPLVYENYGYVFERFVVHQQQTEVDESVLVRQRLFFLFNFRRISEKPVDKIS